MSNLIICNWWFCKAAFCLRRLFYSLQRWVIQTPNQVLQSPWQTGSMRLLLCWTKLSWSQISVQGSSKGANKEWGVGLAETCRGEVKDMITRNTWLEFEWRAWRCRLLQISWIRTTRADNWSLFVFQMWLWISHVDQKSFFWIHWSAFYRSRRWSYPPPLLLPQEIADSTSTASNRNHSGKEGSIQIRLRSISVELQIERVCLAE